MFLFSRNIPISHLLSGSMVSFTFGPVVEGDEAVTVFVLEENSDVFTLSLPLNNNKT